MQMCTSSGFFLLFLQMGTFSAIFPVSFPFQMKSTHKGKNLILKEKILYFKNGPH